MNKFCCPICKRCFPGSDVFSGGLASEGIPSACYNCVCARLEELNKTAGVTKKNDEGEIKEI